MFAKLLPALLGLMITCLSLSCKGDGSLRNDPNTSRGATPTSSDVGEVILALSASTEEVGELRGAVHMDVSGGASQKLSARIPGSSVQALCIIRSDKKNSLGQWEDAVTITPITFNVSGGGCKLRFEGTIALKDFQKFVRGDNSRKWYLRAIISDPSRWEQMHGDYTGRILYDVNRDGGVPFIGSQNATGAPMHKVMSELDVPFGTDWHQLEVRETSTSSTNGFIAPVSDIKFRPLGTLLRFAPQSTLPSTGAHGLNRLKLTSSSFSPAGYFSLADTSPTDADIRFTHSSPNIWSETFRTHRSAETSYGIPTSDNWFLPLWVMPRSVQRLGIEGLKIEAFIMTPTGEQSFPTTYNSLYIDYNMHGHYRALRNILDKGYRKDVDRGQKRKIQSGYTYPVRFKVIRPKLPIEFASQTILGRFRNSQRGEWAELTVWGGAPSGQGLFRVGELHNPTYIPAGTHTPTVKEWKGVFGAQEHNVHNYSEVMNNVVEDVAFNGMDVIDFSDHRSAQVNGKYVRYSLRYKNFQNGKYRSAWRIEVFKNLSTQIQVKVQCVYLGPFWSADINTIANEAWWTTGDGGNRLHTAYGHRVNEVYFSTRGFYDGDTSVDAITAPRRYPNVMVYWLNNGNPYPSTMTNYHLRLDNGVMGYYQEVNQTQRLFPVHPFWDAEPE